jgi:hypothetical protein
LLEQDTQLQFIPEQAFVRANIASVVLYDAIQTIGSNAFDQNQIKSMVLPDTLVNTPNTFLGFQGSSVAQDIWENYPAQSLTPQQKKLTSRIILGTFSSILHRPAPIISRIMPKRVHKLTLIRVS